MRRLRLSCVVAVIGSAGLLVMSAAATASLGRTEVTVFHAFTADGKPTLPIKSLSGYCTTGSPLADRDDAWACWAGYDLYDPCFSSAAAPAVVLCPDYKLTTDTEIRLMRPLPLKQANHGAPSVHGQPWLIELEASTASHGAAPLCERVSAGDNAIDGKRFNYLCSGDGGGIVPMGLWGFPNRQKPEWFILTAPSITQSLAGATNVAIRQAWT